MSKADSPLNLDGQVSSGYKQLIGSLVQIKYISMHLD